MPEDSRRALLAADAEAGGFAAELPLQRRQAASARPAATLPSAVQRDLLRSSASGSGSSSASHGSSLEGAVVAPAAVLAVGRSSWGGFGPSAPGQEPPLSDSDIPVRQCS